VRAVVCKQHLSASRSRHTAQLLLTPANSHSRRRPAAWGERYTWRLSAATFVIIVVIVIVVFVY